MPNAPSADMDNHFTVPNMKALIQTLNRLDNGIPRGRIAINGFFAEFEKSNALEKPVEDNHTDGFSVYIKADCSG